MSGMGRLYMDEIEKRDHIIQKMATLLRESTTLVAYPAPRWRKEVRDVLEEVDNG